MLSGLKQVFLVDADVLRLLEFLFFLQLGAWGVPSRQRNKLIVTAFYFH